MPPVVLTLPFTGRWLVQNSPARRVPSHGTDLFGERYAIDFVAVDARRRTAPVRDWRSVLSTEPASRFYAFGRPILAPVGGVVVVAHDDEPDHAGRRSQLALVPYALGQVSRVRAGLGAVAGNHVVIGLDDRSVYVALVHLREGSVRVRAGERVTVGQQLAECGSSGNSTQPHLHVQAMDGPDASVARGVPVEFRQYRLWHRDGTPTEIVQGIPDERAVVEPSTASGRRRHG
ncbi:M23 family metallopeptidase [Sanguibacter sp. 25GB23B1]|uniref:M23 family metallopeptidase n=1 Tax=unclassified Sanguibacter TaxID=2645534 RepID=UPI0032AEDFC1